MACAGGGWREIALSTEENIKALQSGKLDPNEFKKFRLNNGIYGIRGEEDRHMIRIKCPHGDINADQLDAVAEVAEKYHAAQNVPR